MYTKKKMQRFSAAFLVFFCASAGGVEIDVELEVGVGHTDNITRTEDTVAEPAIDDTVYEAGLALTLEHASARADVNLRGSLFFHDYQDAPYDSETLPAMDLSSLFRITDQSLSWFFIGNVGQQSVDPFQPVTPDNRENISYLTTGPSFFFPVGPRFSLRADLSYSVVDYEEQPLDNASKGGQVSFVRQINPTRSLSLNVRGKRTDFDLDAVHASIDRYDAFVQFSTEGSRNEVSVELGWSVSERSSVQSEEPLVNVEWRRQISSATSLDVSLGSRVSDAAESFRGNQQASIDIGNVQNQQGVTDPFREDYAGLSVMYDRSRTNLTLGGRWADEDYLGSLTAGDRQLLHLFANFSRQLGPQWEFGLFAGHNAYEYEALGREDEDFNAGASLTWRQLRTLEIELRFDRNDRQSRLASDEFTENRVYLGFRYLPEIGRRN